MAPSASQISEALLSLARARGPGRTICPSEAARLLSDNWRPLMPQIRDAAAALAEEGLLRVTQKGVEVDAVLARGPIRIGVPGSDALAPDQLLHGAGTDQID